MLYSFTPLITYHLLTTHLPEGIGVPRECERLVQSVGDQILWCRLCRWRKRTQSHVRHGAWHQAQCGEYEGAAREAKGEGHREVLA